jgi:hypothetical protein
LRSLKQQKALTWIIRIFASGERSSPLSAIPRKAIEAAWRNTAPNRLAEQFPEEV